MTLDEIEEKLTKGHVLFGDLIEIVRTCTSLIDQAKAFREKALVAADRSGPYANRKTMADAANWSATSLGRVLERNGQPRDRRNP